MFDVASLLFGSQGDGPPLCSVAEGRRAITIIIDGQNLVVDVDGLANFSGLFLQVQSTSTKECQLDDFPGGIPTFKLIINLLTNPNKLETLHVQEQNIFNLVEAAWLLECPRIFDEIMDSPYMRSLSSRRKAELLETILPFTQASSPSEGQLEEKSVNEDSSDLDDFAKTFLLETKMWQRTERAAVELCAQLDTNDFVLGPRLATGSLRVSCELLRLHKRRCEEAGFVSNAFQPMSALWKNLTDKPLRAKVCWDAHLYALHCIRKRLPGNSNQVVDSTATAATSPTTLKEVAEDDEAKEDISDETCDSVSDTDLIGLVELVNYIDLTRAPPNWACLLVRALLLSDKMEEAHSAFVTAFAASPRVQQLVWQQPVVVPPAWLVDVAEHIEASQALLRVLQGFRDMPANYLCDIIEEVLLAGFLRLPHTSPVVLASELINDIVGACFQATRQAREPASESTNGDARCPNHWVGQHIVWRLHHTGTRLFIAAFVAQRGFLPHTWPDCLGSGCLRLSEDDIKMQDELPFQLEPVVTKIVGNCLWDEGLLVTELLKPVMEAGRANPEGFILYFGQQAIMRHLWHSFHGTYIDAPRLHGLWELACWSLCEDVGLIRQAFEYLKGVYRELHSDNGQWCPEHEELVFQMFLALDLSRLSVRAMLTMWIPPQVQTVFLLVQQQPLEHQNSEIERHIGAANENLHAINTQCSKLANKLNIVEQRTLINRGQIQDATTVIEEHKKRKSESAAQKRLSSTPDRKAKDGH